MNQLRCIKLVLAVIGIVIPSRGFAQVIYSQDFDSGSAGMSLTDPQFGFTLHNTGGVGGDLKLGAAQHGWSGNTGFSVIGNDADPGELNYLYKYLSLPTHGLIRFSVDAFSPTLTPGPELGIQLFNGTPGFGQRGIDLRALESGWFSQNLLGGNAWTSPAGMHDEPVTASVFWNQDTGEHWAEVSNGSQTFASTHGFDATAGPMTGIAVYIDRRGGSIAPGDMDNFRLVASPVPEPWTMGFIGLALAAAARRRNRKPA